MFSDRLALHDRWSGLHQAVQYHQLATRLQTSPTAVHALADELAALAARVSTVAAHPAAWRCAVNTTPAVSWRTPLMRKFLDPTASSAYPAHACPLCGQPNSCQMASTAGDGRAASCWCVNQPLPPALLASVPAAAQHRACVCATCVRQHQAKGAAASTEPPPRADLAAWLTGRRQGTSDVLPRVFVAMPLQVHHVALVLPSVSFFHADAPALSLLGTIMTDRFLHREVREKGGAYGGGCYQNSTDGVFGFYSFRDPNCDRTLDAFHRAVAWIAGPVLPVTQTDLDEALLSVFAEVDKAVSPSAVGSGRFLRGIDHAAREAYRQRLLAVTRDDLSRVARHWLRDALEAQQASVCAVGPDAGAAIEATRWDVRPLAAIL